MVYIAIGGFVVIAALLTVMHAGPSGTNTTNGPPPASVQPDKGPSSRLSPRAQPPTAKTTDTITVGNRPLGVAVSPDGRRAYISNYVSDTVSVIDTGNNAVIGTITVGDNPVGVAVSPDGHHAYATNFGSGSVSVIDTRTNAVTEAYGFATPWRSPALCAPRPSAKRP